MRHKSLNVCTSKMQPLAPSLGGQSAQTPAAHVSKSVEGNPQSVQLMCICTGSMKITKLKKDRIRLSHYKIEIKIKIRLD